MNVQLEILLAGGDDANIDLIRRAFNKHPGGGSLRVARNAKEMHSLLREHAPDILIVDHNFQDGRVADFLRSQMSLLFPVVVMTTEDEPRINTDALQVGAAKFIPKSPSTLEHMPEIAQDVFVRWKMQGSRIPSGSSH